MAKRKSQIDIAIEELDAEIAKLQHSRRVLEGVRVAAKSARERKPKAVKPRAVPEDKAS